MKKVELSNIRYPKNKPIRTKDRKYQVFLTPKKDRYFNSMREARQYVAETNRFLNQCLHRINKNYADTFKIYRHMWFYFFDRNKIVNREHLERKIRTNFDTIDNALNRFIHNTIGINGNTFAFNFLEIALNELIEALDILEEIVVIRNELVLKYEIRTLRIQIKDINQSIADYN